MISTCDVKKEEDVEKLYKDTFEKYGHIDIVVANAGINGVWAPIEDLKVYPTLKLNITYYLNG
jgi:NAD(P)-dependent dehydrogenase (short-subunit alcohol dehydrogenase family)